jgi:hypothetical protein
MGTYQSDETLCEAAGPTRQMGHRARLQRAQQAKVPGHVRLVKICTAVLPSNA